MKPSSGRLLILSLERLSEASRMRVLRLARRLGSAQTGERIFELQADSEEDLGLRTVAELCAEKGGTAWLFAELPQPSPPDGAYRPITDHSERHAPSLDAWRRGQGPVPALLPGEMVRLA